MSAENVVNIQRDSPQYINKIDELRVKGEEMNSDHLIKCYEHLLKYNQGLKYFLFIFVSFILTP